MEESFEDIEREEGRGLRGNDRVWEGQEGSPAEGGDRKTPCGDHTGRRAAAGKGWQMESSERPSLECTGANHSAFVCDRATGP